MSTAYLVILGDREAIAWVLRGQRMAFPRTPRAEVAALAPGARLYLYSTVAPGTTRPATGIG